MEVKHVLFVSLFAVLKLLLQKKKKNLQKKNAQYAIITRNHQLLISLNRFHAYIISIYVKLMVKNEFLVVLGKIEIGNFSEN